MKRNEWKMKLIMSLACALMASAVTAQTTVTETTTTVTKVEQLDTTHLLTVNNFAPGDKISVQTAPQTRPLTIRLANPIAYTNENGEPISTSSIQPGSHVRLEFSGSGPDRMVTRVVFVSAK